VAVQRWLPDQRDRHTIEGATALLVYGWMMFNVVERRDISPNALTVLGASTTVHTVKTSLYGARSVHVRQLILLLFSSEIKSQFIAVWMAWHQRTFTELCPCYTEQIKPSFTIVILFSTNCSLTVYAVIALCLFLVASLGWFTWLGYLRNPSLSIELFNFKRYLKTFLFTQY